MDSRTIRLLRGLGACDEAIDWARGYPNRTVAWNACQRGDWMMWILARLVEPGSAAHRALVMFACKCIRRAMRSKMALKCSPGVRDFLLAIERWAAGKTSERDLLSLEEDLGWEMRKPDYNLPDWAVCSAFLLTGCMRTPRRQLAFHASDIGLDSVVIRNVDVCSRKGMWLLRGLAAMIRKEFPDPPRARKLRRRH